MREFVNKNEFKNFNKIIIQNADSYAANCIQVKDTVIRPFDYLKVENDIKK